MFIASLGFTPEGAQQIYRDLAQADELFVPFVYPYLRVNYILTAGLALAESFTVSIDPITEKDQVAWGVDEAWDSALEARREREMSAKAYDSHQRSRIRGYSPSDLPRRPLLVMNRMCFMQHGVEKRVELHHTGTAYELHTLRKGSLEPLRQKLGAPDLALQ